MVQISPKSPNGLHLFGPFRPCWTIGLNQNLVIYVSLRLNAVWTKGLKFSPDQHIFADLRLAQSKGAVFFCPSSVLKKFPSFFDLLSLIDYYFKYTTSSLIGKIFQRAFQRCIKL